MYLQNLLLVSSYFFSRQQIHHVSYFTNEKIESDVSNILSITNYPKERKIERKKERNGRFQMSTFFSTASVDRTFVGIQGPTKRDKTNCIFLSPPEMLAKKNPSFRS